MLSASFSGKILEVGCDEAGRGCLAGPVFAAAVILPKDYKNNVLNDSKKLKQTQREDLRKEIEKNALAYAVAEVSPQEIDEINILWASVKAMHKAIAQLSIIPEYILVDGNRFRPYENIPHTCIVKGDGKYMNIAAASILAKTYRDAHMENLHASHIEYDWINNKGYPTATHRSAIMNYGITSHHRLSFRLIEETNQLKLF